MLNIIIILLFLKYGQLISAAPSFSQTSLHKGFSTSLQKKFIHTKEGFFWRSYQGDGGGNLHSYPTSTWNLPLTSFFS